MTAGNTSEFTQAITLMEGFEPEHVLSDRGYDSDEIVSFIENDLEAKPVIPPRKNRKVLRDYDREIYKERNLMERLFLKLKHFRRIATRYERLKCTFCGMLQLVASILCLA